LEEEMQKEKTKLSEKLNYLAITIGYVIFYLAMNKIPHTSKRKHKIHKKDKLAITIWVVSILSTFPIWVPIIFLSMVVAYFENKKSLLKK